VTLKYYKGQTIIEEGDPGSSFYMIKEGTASLLQGNLEERKIYKGESFGHNSLYYNTMRKMTVRAEEDVVCQVLGRETLAKIVGADFREVMFRNYVKHVVQKNRVLFAVMKRDEEGFFEGMKVQYRKSNEVVFRKGTTVQRLLVVMEGKLKKFRSANYLAEAGQTWG
jgi:cGMP-dependent protein kinase